MAANPLRTSAPVRMLRSRLRRRDEEHVEAPAASALLAEGDERAEPEPQALPIPRPPQPSLRKRAVTLLFGWCNCEARQFKSRHEVAANTTLQMMVYFNAYLSCVWAIGWLLIFSWKLGVFGAPIYVVLITPVLYFGWLVLEPIRLALGYLGNLHERVSWLGSNRC
mmetsp:Transcript_27896/g.65099  ORF Transcript_27896/g.65099 Transcript_27896/m.65099 type:complete len:166 (-) Transcript_27896:70-567(-)